MILIADSGSTKTDWCMVNNGTLIQASLGLNEDSKSDKIINLKI